MSLLILFTAITFSGCSEKGQLSKSKIATFQVLLPSGESYLIVPNQAKIEQARMAVGPVSDFERTVRKQISIDSKQKKQIDLSELIVGTLRVRRDDGTSTPPMHFRLKQFAEIRALER